jgi:hypothetical protein
VTYRGRRSRVVLTPRRWRQVGDDARASCRRWWQKSPAHQEEHEGNRKTIAQGMPALAVRTCGDYARVLFSFAHEAAGASDAPGIPCALFKREGRRFSKPGRENAPREGGVLPHYCNSGSALSPACGAGLSHMVVRVSYPSPTSVSEWWGGKTRMK